VPHLENVWRRILESLYGYLSDSGSLKARKSVQGSTRVDQPTFRVTADSPVERIYNTVRRQGISTIPD